MAAEPPSVHEDSWLQDMVSFFKGFELEIQELWEQGYFESEDNETALTELMDASGEELLVLRSFIRSRRRFISLQPPRTDGF